MLLFGTINFTTKNQSQPIWTGSFRLVDQLGPVFKGPVAVPEYLKWSRLVAVASCLVLREKKLALTGLENTIDDCRKIFSNGFVCLTSSFIHNVADMTWFKLMDIAVGLGVENSFNLSKSKLEIH